MSALDEIEDVQFCDNDAREAAEAKREVLRIVAALQAERDALKVALEYIRNYDNYASDGDVYIEDGNSYTHVSNYAESVIKTYSAGNE